MSATTIKGVVVHPERRYQIGLNRRVYVDALRRELSARLNETHGVSGAIAISLADDIRSIREDPHG
ncbi:hypothetical protein ATO13_22636 [Stappia sp. 22II-S9-Z10]|nr:hypothetical protein ATO13_22636 [Stappia sp. 22II-S9-Z10]